MEESAPRTPAEEIAGAFDWWRDAGVDLAFTDVPQSWLAKTEIAPPASPCVGGDLRPQGSPSAADRGPRVREDAPVQPIAPLPADLPAFIPWWLSEPSLDGGRVAGRVPPRGAAEAELMILVPDPEPDDTDVLLSGLQGKLLDAMLQAMGVAPETAYVASVLPRHTPLADWPALTAGALPAVLAHHVRLVAPKRLLVFGGSVLPLLGHELPNSSASLPRFNHEIGSVPLLVDRDLPALLAKPAWKGRFWQRWLDWTG